MYVVAIKHALPPTHAEFRLLGFRDFIRRTAARPHRHLLALKASVPFTLGGHPATQVAPALLHVAFHKFLQGCLSINISSRGGNKSKKKSSTYLIVWLKLVLTREHVSRDQFF